MTTTAVVTRKEVTLSHGKTRYLEAGAGETVLLIHGVSVVGGADDWRPAIEHLSAKYRVLAPDLVGWPPGDTYANMDAFPYLTDFVREFQDALGIRSSHIIGATMGGWIAGLFAYESPDRVQKLIMTGNPGFHGAPNDRLANFEAPSEEKAREALVKVTETMSDAEREDLVQEKVRRLDEPGYADAFGRMMKTMANADNRKRFVLTRRLPSLTMPTLFLLGRGDPSSAMADELKSLVPGSSAYIIEDGAHQIHYENAPEFSKAVADFLG
ncbi:MAG: alpha/beta fold hydrolase [Dehalococcoidia bacterium]|nr:alpha/beta fold hydrolase [Dehalococcoidia bacterium]